MPQLDDILRRDFRREVAPYVADLLAAASPAVDVRDRAAAMLTCAARLAGALEPWDGLFVVQECLPPQLRTPEVSAFVVAVLHWFTDVLTPPRPGDDGERTERRDRAAAAAEALWPRFTPQES